MLKQAGRVGLPTSQSVREGGSEGGGLVWCEKGLCVPKGPILARNLFFCPPGQWPGRAQRARPFCGADPRLVTAPSKAH